MKRTVTINNYIPLILIQNNINNIYITQLINLTWPKLHVHIRYDLKWYYDQNRIFPIAAILKHKKVAWKLLTFWNQMSGDWRRVSCHGNIICIVVGVFPVDLLAYQVSMVCAANWPRYLYIYILNIKLGWVYDVIRKHLHNLHIFPT